MNQAEFDEACKSTTETVQVFLLDGDGGVDLMVRFPPGRRIVRIRHPAPRGHIFEERAGVDMAVQVRHRLMNTVKKPGRSEEQLQAIYKYDQELLNFTNWVSLGAAITAELREFNRRNMHREVRRVQ